MSAADLQGIYMTAFFSPAPVPEKVANILNQINPPVQALPALEVYDPQIAAWLYKYRVRNILLSLFLFQFLQEFWYMSVRVTILIIPQIATFKH